MPLFISDEEFSRCSGDTAAVAAKADAFIRGLLHELDTVRAKADAADINAEQNCALIEQKYLSLAAEFSTLELHVAELQSSLDHRTREISEAQSQKHQIDMQSVEKDREIERLRKEAAELHKSRRDLIELNEMKSTELSEKNATMKSYLDKIVHLTEHAAHKEARLSEVEAELARCKAACTRLEQEKEIVEKQTFWLNEELDAKANSLFELRRKHSELEADMSSKLADEFISAKDAAAANEEQLSAELSTVSAITIPLLKKETCGGVCIEDCRGQLWPLLGAGNGVFFAHFFLLFCVFLSGLLGDNHSPLYSEMNFSSLTSSNVVPFSIFVLCSEPPFSVVNKLNELYKESSEEWSKKAADLEGVIKAMESHLKQVENGYSETLEKELSARKQVEKEAADLKEKLEKCEAELETRKKNTDEMSNLLPGSFTSELWLESTEADSMVEENSLIVPKIPVGVSGTALAASLLRDGWSLAKIYAKYHEAVDALRHEQLGRKESESLLQRVLNELEEKADAIIDERVEHERMVYPLQADLKRRERDCDLVQNENDDLRKQVTVLLKECRDIQLRCGGSMGYDIDDDASNNIASRTIAETEAEHVISQHLLTFKDIKGLVEQNTQLRSLVRSLSGQIENQELEFKEKLEMELKKHTEEAASKVAAVLQRAEEQGQMIESLHATVAMYKRLYEEQNLQISHTHSSEALAAVSEVGRNNLKTSIESSQSRLGLKLHRSVVTCAEIKLLYCEEYKEAAKKSLEKAAERVRCLEDDLAKSRSEIIVLRSECEKMALEANFARERLDSFMKEFEHQATEAKGILERNVEFSQLVVDYQRKLRESSESLMAAEELSRKLTMELSVLKQEKEVISNAEKRASDEVRSLSERVMRLQASLGTIQSTEEVREEARAAERVKQEEYIKKLEREWAEAKQELHEERENVRRLTLDRDQTLKNSMRQVEDTNKELANALRAVASAESRAAVAEAKYSSLQSKMGSTDEKVCFFDWFCYFMKCVADGLSFRTIQILVCHVTAVFGRHYMEAQFFVCLPGTVLSNVSWLVEMGGVSGSSTLSSDEVVAELQKAKEEIENLKEEANAYKTHMLQANEDALKQIEKAHEKFKTEADNAKKVLESELNSLREKLLEIENESCLKYEEAASKTVGKDEALTSAMAEITNLKEEILTKSSQISAMEIQISGLKENLDMEHQKWRAAQTNYERQVVLQSETIQELTKTSEALAVLKEEASELRKLNELNAKWEHEKIELEKSRNDAEKKYNEINEQNKILHSQLEAFHIQWAEKERNAAGISSGTSSGDAFGDGSGLQKTEVSLLKQEKLRLQSQLDGALKAVDSAHASLETERAKSRSFLFTEDEFKALQLQVREMNLLRESNMQLREENKHNFNECQKLRELAQKARVEAENLENLLREREIELEGHKKEVEMLKMEKDHLNNQVSELLERSKNVDIEDYDRVKKLARDIQDKLRDKDAQIEEISKILSEKQDSVSRLEQDLSNCRLELAEKEKKINDILRSEANLKLESEKHRKLLAQFKKKIDILSREKDDLGKENQQLTRQLDEIKQGKRSTSDTSGEQAMKEEKDTRIQILEKHLERLREELKKEKDENRIERGRRLKTEKAIKDSYNIVEQEKTKFINEIEGHKKSLKRLSDEVEKHRVVVGNLPEGTNVAQLSGSNVDESAAPYLSAVETFEKEAHSVFREFGGRGNLGEAATATDGSAAATGSVVHSQSQTIIPLAAPGATVLRPKASGESEKRLALPKASLETRKTGRRLVRPRLVRPDEPQGDAEMSDAEGAGSKPGPSSDTETSSFAQSSQPSVRKRVAPTSTSELREESVAPGEKNSEAPVLKKSKGSESPEESTEEQPAATLEFTGSQPITEELFDSGDLPQGQNEEVSEAQNEDGEIAVGNDEESEDPPQLDGTNQEELQGDKTGILEESADQAIDTKISSDEMSSEHTEAENQQSTLAPSSDREEGELLPDSGDVEGDLSNMVENQECREESAATPERSPARVDDEDLEAGEINSPELSSEDKNDESELVEEAGDGADKLLDVNEPISVESDQVGIASEVATLTSASESSSSSKGKLPVAAKPNESEETKQASTIGSTSTTINLSERARERSQMRQAGFVPSLPRPRGGRPGNHPPRGRVSRGGRVGGRRPPPSSGSGSGSEP
ncbi:hypothetical protein Fmac_018538 [Flemingia macrophylla]|uniref:Nucleoprotein TPR/MLP1 domain-containing protein n=1 Tax=Flemingia macrophylla TaxID=520843 RepID=A0ABD1M590_9FABA